MTKTVVGVDDTKKAVDVDDDDGFKYTHIIKNDQFNINNCSDKVGGDLNFFFFLPNQHRSHRHYTTPPPKKKNW